MEIATCVTLRVCNARVRKRRTAPAARYHGDAQAPALRRWACMHACMPNAGDGACIWHFLISKHQKIISCVHPLLPPAGSSTMADVATGVRGGVLQRGTSAPSVTTPVRSAPTKALITAPAVIQVDAQPLGKGQNMHMYSHPKRSKRLFLPLKNRDVSFSYFSNNWTI